MATTTRKFLEVDQYFIGRKPRSHSSGDVDRLEEQEQIERRNNERRMKEYYENTRQVSTVHQRPKSDFLSVPIREINRKPRSAERSEQPSNRTPRRHRVEEVKPDPKLYDYDLNPEPASPSQISMPIRERSFRVKSKSKVPPIIIQEDPPLLSKTAAKSSRRSPSTSPHSPTAQPLLQVQYARLQDKLSQICDSCERHLEVEPANPRDLTFTKIRETVEGFAEDLHIWCHVANLDGLARIDKSMRHLVDAASEILDRLVDRVTALRKACANATPKDLKLPLLEEMDDADDVDLYDDDDDDDEGDVYVEDPTKAPGFMIDSLLQSVGLQIRQLKLLSPSLREATPDVEDEMRKVARLVREAGKFFGSEAALVRYSIDPKFAGNTAFVEARSAAGSA